jgi:hypothetical protein
MELSSTPIRGKALQKVVTLDVAVVVCSWNVGRIEIDEIRVRLKLDFENVSAHGRVFAAVVVDKLIEDRNRLPEVLLEGETEVPATVVIPTKTRNRKDPARLPLETGAIETCFGESLLVG